METTIAITTVNYRGRPITIKERVVVEHSNARMESYITIPERRVFLPDETRAIWLGENTVLKEEEQQDGMD